jgi:hypothetical protein
LRDFLVVFGVQLGGQFCGSLVDRGIGVLMVGGAGGGELSNRGGGAVYSMTWSDEEEDSRKKKRLQGEKGIKLGKCWEMLLR